MRDMPAFRLVNKRFAAVFDEEWSGICVRRFPGAVNLPPDYLWALCTSSYASDESVRVILALLNRIHAEWPDALSTHLDGINNRWCQLCASFRAKTGAPGASSDEVLPAGVRLPADAAVLYLLGASFVGASPIGTLSGDFGPEFDADTERELWRVGLSWPPLREEADLASAPTSSYSLQSFKEYGEFYDPTGVHYGRALFAGSEHLFLAAGFTEFTVHGTEMWLSVDCCGGRSYSVDSSGGGENGGGGGEATRSGGEATRSGGGGSTASGGDGGIDTTGNLHFIILGEEREERFPAMIGGKPLTLSRLLELMLDIVSAHQGQGKSWEAAWWETDFYGGVCAALDPHPGADGSSVDDDGEGEEEGLPESESEEEEDEDESSSSSSSVVDDQDEYPAAMLDA